MGGVVQPGWMHLSTLSIMSAGCSKGMHSDLAPMAGAPGSASSPLQTKDWQYENLMYNQGAGKGLQHSPGTVRLDSLLTGGATTEGCQQQVLLVEQLAELQPILGLLGVIGQVHLGLGQHAVVYSFQELL